MPISSPRCRLAGLATVALAALAGTASAEPSSGGNSQLMFWAAVQSDGTLMGRRGVSGVVRTGVGQYTVLFKQSVRNCFPAATVGDVDQVATPAPGQIAVAKAPGNAKGLTVATYNAAGTGTDQDFYLLLACPTNKD